MANKKEALASVTGAWRARRHRMSKILAYSNRQLQDRELTITFKPQVASKIKAIAEQEGTDSTCQVMLAIASFINERWDWKGNKPKPRSCVEVADDPRIRS